jgi:hypothetical protein
LKNPIYAALRMLADLRGADLANSKDYVLCSECFHDQGLRHDAARKGVENNSACINCGSERGRKLDRLTLNSVVHAFFMWGTLYRSEFGAAPIVAFNEVQETSIKIPPWLVSDIRLIETALGVGFFYYGPRLWMIGQVEPLLALQDESTRASVIGRIISEYPIATMSAKETFYRLRRDPANPEQFEEYDSPPIALAGAGRLDSSEFPVMYGSQDLQICVHECRVTAEDNLFVATLEPKRDLKLLDLAYLLPEKETEFESLDMAVHMLFLAGKHSYPITREIALSAHQEGFDGLVYPSYFSLLRTGGMPFETVMGISHRQIPEFAEYERAKTIRNLAIFGRPIQSGIVGIQCVNKLIMHKVDYGVHFGPVGVDPDPINGDGTEPADSSDTGNDQ